MIQEAEFEILGGRVSRVFFKSSLSGRLSSNSRPGCLGGKGCLSVGSCCAQWMFQGETTLLTLWETKLTRVVHDGSCG